jgi:pimeloyl-ACP methyl ester carboxylesterase
MRCPGVPAPPAAELLGLTRTGIESDRVTRSTSVAFRKAGIDGLLAAWTLGASTVRWLRQLSGQAVPRVRKDWQTIRYSTADNGRLLEVRGDLAAATHVVLLVPGMTNELANVDRDLRPRSQQVYDELIARAQPGQRVAVVMWLGYRNPAAFPDPYRAVGSAMAERGAQTLAADVRALRSVGSNAHITVVAHSYGTVVAGEAMGLGLAADRVVVVGSPGMNTSSRTALGSPGVELFASSVGTTVSGPRAVLRTVGRLAANSNDVARIGVDIATGRDWAAATSTLGLHGADPAQPTFGAHPFLSSGSGHSAYFEPRSLGITNIALIGLGRQPVRSVKQAGPAQRPRIMKPGPPKRLPRTKPVDRASTGA